MGSYAPPAAGHFYPRIARPPRDRPETADVWDAASSTATALHMLLADLKEIFAVVEPDATNDNVFGHEIRRQLLLASMEVESGLAAVLRANNYHVGARYTTNDYVKVADPLRLREYRVAFHQWPRYADPLEPFAGWDDTRPTQSLDWYDAYNATKHNRELNLSRATLRHLVTAVAASFVVASTQFGTSMFVPPSELAQTSVYFSFAPNLKAEAYQPPSAAGLADWATTNYPFP